MELFLQKKKKEKEIISHKFALTTTWQVKTGTLEFISNGIVAYNNFWHAHGHLFLNASKHWST